jgi:hypothetical protein
MSVRSVVVFFVVLLGPLSLPHAAGASPMSLYGPFDQTHNGIHGHAAHAVSPPAGASSEVLGGCGRGRTRDPETQRCRGPADLH